MRLASSSPRDHCWFLALLWAFLPSRRACAELYIQRSGEPESPLGRRAVWPFPSSGPRGPHFRSRALRNQACSISGRLSGPMPHDLHALLPPWGDPTGPEGNSQLRAGTGWVAVGGLGWWGGGVGGTTGEAGLFSRVPESVPCGLTSFFPLKCCKIPEHRPRPLQL